MKGERKNIIKSKNVQLTFMMMMDMMNDDMNHRQIRNDEDDEVE